MGDTMLVSEAARHCKLTPRRIQQLIEQKEDGPFPGAFLVSDAPRPYYRIPTKEVVAFKKKSDQRPG